MLAQGRAGAHRRLMLEAPEEGVRVAQVFVQRTCVNGVAFSDGEVWLRYKLGAGTKL